MWDNCFGKWYKWHISLSILKINRYKFLLKFIIKLPLHWDVDVFKNYPVGQIHWFPDKINPLKQLQFGAAIVYCVILQV